jgi:hypothetical protein
MVQASRHDIPVNALTRLKLEMKGDSVPALLDLYPLQLVIFLGGAVAVSLSTPLKFTHQIGVIQLAAFDLDREFLLSFSYPVIHCRTLLSIR